jgi:hypothetical protein
VAAGLGVATIEAGIERRTVLAALALVLAGMPPLLLIPGASLAELGLALPIRDVFLGALAEPGGWARLAMPIALAVAVLLLVSAAPPGLRGRCALVVTGLCALELLVTLAPAAWYADTRVLASPPSAAVRFLQEHLVGGQYRMLAAPAVGRPSTPSLFGLRDVRSVTALPVERYARFLEAVSSAGRWYFVQHPGPVARHPLLDVGAVRYVTRTAGPRDADLLDNDAQMRRVYRDERVVIYENAAALPRARIVHAALPVSNQEEAFDRLTEVAAGGTHAAAVGLADRIVVEPSADGRAPPTMEEAGPTAGEAIHVVDGADPDRIELDASLRRPGWVVLADTFYPGWTATIDGAAAPIHPADLLFRAVHMPAGDHHIVFAYAPGSFRLGVALASVGLAVCGFLLVCARRVSP